MAKSKYIQSVVKAAKGRPRSTDWFRDPNGELSKLEEEIKRLKVST